MNDIRTVLPPPMPDRPPAPPAKQGPRVVKVVSVPQGGWVLVEGDAPVAVALDEAGAGVALTALLGVRL